MFDPRIPYHRRMWHYDSDRALSAAQLIALGSLDARTAALLWLLIERHQSLIVSGPTDPDTRHRQDDHPQRAARLSAARHDAGLHDRHVRRLRLQ